MVYQLHGLFWHDFSMIDYVMNCIILMTLYITIVSGVIVIFLAIVISFHYYLFKTLNFVLKEAFTYMIRTLTFLWDNFHVDVINVYL
jgi:hypothetical protein